MYSIYQRQRDREGDWAGERESEEEREGEGREREKGVGWGDRHGRDKKIEIARERGVDTLKTIALHVYINN